MTRMPEASILCAIGAQVKGPTDGLWTRTKATSIRPPCTTNPAFATRVVTLTANTERRPPRTIPIDKRTIPMDKRTIPMDNMIAVMPWPAGRSRDPGEPTRGPTSYGKRTSSESQRPNHLGVGIDQRGIGGDHGRDGLVAVGDRADRGGTRRIGPDIHPEETVGPPAQR